jgi:hypothetical protein
MVWGARKGSLGHVKTMYNRLTGENKIISLTISTFHALPYREFKDTLAHEMIHIKQLSTLKPQTYDPHGHTFHSEMRRINQMGLGFNIQIFNDGNLDVSDTSKAKAKDMLCIIFKLDNKVFACTATLSAYTNEFKNVVRLFQGLVNRGKYRLAEITVIESKNPVLLKYPMKRTFKSGVTYAPVSDELYNELLKDKIIKQEKITVGSPAMAEENKGEWEEIIIV